MLIIIISYKLKINCAFFLTDNFPPNITASNVFLVNLRQESVFMLTVTDPGDEFSLNIRGGLPENSILDESGGQFTFRWILQQVTFEPLVFVANDSRNATTLFIPTVEVCACENGGTCTRNGLLTNNATILLNCQCSNGKILSCSCSKYL